MVKGDLVRINKNTSGSADIGSYTNIDKLYPPVDEGELGIYLGVCKKHGYYKIIFIFSLQKALGFYPFEIEPLKKEQ